MLLVAGMVAFSSFKFFQDKSMARAQRVQGKLVFVKCDPVEEYTVVDELTTNLSLAIGGQQKIDDQLKELIGRANKQVEKGKMGEYDGVITDDGQRGTFIKFKE